MLSELLRSWWDSIQSMNSYAGDARRGGGGGGGAEERQRENTRQAKGSRCRRCKVLGKQVAARRRERHHSQGRRPQHG